MPRAVKDMTLTPQVDPSMTLFERMATDPNASVEKIERLMALWERGQAKQAESAFYGAMADAQSEMRSVATDATNPQTRSRYATYEALDRALRPVYTKYGFALSFNTEDAPQPDMMRLLCLVAHKGGHSREYRIDMPADGKGAKGGDVMTRTHAVGAAATYGMRYLLKMVWNVAVGEGDTDGNAPKPTPKEPAGFADWLTDIAASADEGWAVMEAAWKSSRPEYKEYAPKHYRDRLVELKKKAQAVTA